VSGSIMRVAVVGLGPMGLNHVRAWRRLPDAELTAVVDIHPERAHVAAKEFGCRALADFKALKGVADAVTIATPAVAHAAMAEALLAAGIHCLVEKPLAVSPAEADRLSRANGATLRVGHVERFNPAFVAFRRHPCRAIGAIEARRLNLPGRAVAIDVVTDLMVHDIDLVLTMKGAEPAAVTARQVGPDHVEAELAFADGTIARLAANRRAARPERTMRIDADGVEVRVDFLARTVIPANGVGVAASSDALEAELSDFLVACRGGGGAGATAAEAHAALKIAWAIRGQAGMS
jgi:predicted dehydrogenase